MKAIKLTLFGFLISIASWAQTVTISGLNTTAISVTGNEKIPISGPGDPATTINNLASWVTGYVVIPVTYNSGVNQASIIQAAHDAATAGQTLCMLGLGVVKVETQITWTKDDVHLVTGWGTDVHTTSNIAMFVFSGADRIMIKGGIFSGNNTGAAQIGLSFLNCSGIRVYEITVTGFNLAAIRVNGGSNAAPYERNLFLGVNAFDNNGICYDTLATGEYVLFEACAAWNTVAGTGTGWKLASGNISLVGCYGTNLNSAFTTATGTNNGHSTIGNSIFNHNTNLVTISGIDNTGTNPLSLVFNGCEFFAGAFTVNSDLIFFNTCQISVTTITNNGNNINYSDCRIHGL